MRTATRAPVLETLSAGNAAVRERSRAPLQSSLPSPQRPAGTIADDDGFGSIEYAVEHFHSPLLFVLGGIRERSAVVAAAERRGALRVAGATYDLGDGRVTFL